MKSEKQKMLSGEMYDPLDNVLSNERLHTRLLLKRINDSREDKVEERTKILEKFTSICRKRFMDPAALLL